MNRTRLKPTPFKGKKHTRTKALAITPETKLEVWNRDEHCSVWSRKPVPKECACCHFIRRSQSGLGIPQNILTLTPEEHETFDSGPIEIREEMRRFFKNYLSVYYADWEWSEEKLKFKKEF